VLKGVFGVTTEERCAEGGIWGYAGGINKMVEETSHLLFTKQY